jgi:methylase of polypeptide subunit release factors
MLDAAGSARLREALTAAGYAADDLAAVRAVGGPEPGSALDTLLQVFEYGRTVPADRLAAALRPLSLDQAARAGIVDVDQVGARAMVYIQPYRQWWLLADLPRKLRPGPLPRDHVLGAGQLAMVLARAAIRDPVGSALDLCCGGGVQSLHLSGHAGMVTGTDLSARALAFAATTAAINGLDWRLVRGSLIEPVAGQRFDLVVCNPPFIVGPGDVGYLYRDAGLPGDQLGAELARAAPRLLNEGGYMQYLASWAHVTGQDWTDRVASWVAGTGLDAWIVQLDIRDAAEYVRAWSPDPDSAADRAWVGWLRRQRMEAISCGLITLRRTGRADPVIRTDDLAGHDLAGDDVSAWFRRRDWLRDHDLLAARFRPVHGLSLQTDAQLHAGRWVNDRYQLTTPGGPRRTDQVSDLIVAIVTSCDGATSLAEQLTRLAAQLGADPAELRAAAIPAIVQLIEHHIIEPGPAI